MNSPFTPTDRMLRQFAGLWMLFFGWAAWRASVHQQDVLAYILIGLTVTVGPLGMMKPAFIRPIFVGWMTLVYPIGWLVSRIVLGTLFYGLFTPLALVFRQAGRDELRLKQDRAKNSYWLAKPHITDKSRYLRQF